jgi:hypothetical protein
MHAPPKIVLYWLKTRIRLIDFHHKSGYAPVTIVDDRKIINDDL